MDLPEANSTTVHNLYRDCLCRSSLSLSVMVRSCHACVNLSRLRFSGFTPTLRSGSDPSLTQQWAGHAQNYPRTFGLHKIFKCAYLKFTVYGRKHTHNFRNAVTLVWGSLRLAPIILLFILSEKYLIWDIVHFICRCSNC